jgi:hypothetical protein
MTHELWHIICGGVGKVVAWLLLKDGETTVQIPKYSRAFVNIIYTSEGMKHKDVEKAEKLIADFRHKFYKLVAQPGDDIHYQSPEPPHEH